jgi:hypothetical protein
MYRNPLAQTASLLPTLRPRFSVDGRFRTVRLPQGFWTYRPQEKEKGRPIGQIEWRGLCYLLMVYPRRRLLSIMEAVCR